MKEKTLEERKQSPDYPESEDEWEEAMKEKTLSKEDPYKEFKDKDGNFIMCPIV